jgi:hypothetical protein
MSDTPTTVDAALIAGLRRLDNLLRFVERVRARLP